MSEGNDNHELSVKGQERREFNTTAEEWEKQLLGIYPGFSMAIELIHRRYGDGEDEKGSPIRGDLRRLVKDASAYWVGYKPENLAENCETLMDNLVARYEREDEQEEAFVADLERPQSGVHSLAKIREVMENLPKGATGRDFLNAVKSTK